MPAATSPNERQRQADQLLFGGLSSLAEPVGPGGLARGEGFSTDKADVKPQAPAAEAVTSRIHVKADRVRPTGRVLPDLLEQSRARMRLRQESEEREVRLRAQRSASRPNSGSRPKRASARTSAGPHAAPKVILDSTPTPEVSLKEPVMAAAKVGAPAAVELVTASSPSSPSSPRQRTGPARGNTRRPESQTVGRRSERQEACMLLRAGDKWKRRLPRVCW